MGLTVFSLAPLVDYVFMLSITELVTTQSLLLIHHGLYHSWLDEVRMNNPQGEV